jgi:hypothetical protein
LLAAAAAEVGVVIKNLKSPNVYTERRERALTLKARACVHTCGTVSNRIERRARANERRGGWKKNKEPRGGQGPPPSLPAPLGGNEISPSHLAASLRNVIGPDSGALTSRWDAPTYTPSGSYYSYYYYAKLFFLSLFLLFQSFHHFPSSLPPPSLPPSF